MRAAPKRAYWSAAEVFLTVLYAAFVGAVILSACPGCAPALPPEAEVIEVAPIERTCERWFRLGDDVPDEVRRVAEQAAADIRRELSPRIRIAFGPSGKDQFLVALDGSDQAARIDFLYGSASKTVDGVTTAFDDGGPRARVRVTILPGRIERAKLWRVVAHELLHACGLFDVAEEGNAMTGEEPRNAPPVREFGPADVREARRMGY